MKFLRKLFGGSETAEIVIDRVSVEMSIVIPDLVTVSGTTTVAKDQARAAMAAHSIDGYLETRGAMLRELQGGAVAVLVGQQRVGYLPKFVGDRISLASGESRPIRVQLFGEELPSGLRVEAWAWLATSKPAWEWSKNRRPPMTPASRNQAEHEFRAKLVRDGLREGGARAESFRTGMVDGTHFLETVEPIKQLKRDGRLEEALALCMTAITGAENEARFERTVPAPFYNEQAAIVLRKLGRGDDEVAVLRRYLAACPPGLPGGRIKERLDKLTA